MTELHITQLPYVTPDIEVIGTYLEEHTQEHPINTVNWQAYPYTPEVHFWTAYNKDSLFIHYKVQEDYTKAIHTDNNSEVHKDSCVEFFVSPIDEYYFNFEFNAIGTKYAARRKSRQEYQFLDQNSLDRIETFSSLGNTPFSEVQLKDKWTLTIKIPLDILWIDRLPSKGDCFRANFYKCGDELTQAHFLTWSEINTPEPDFHRPEYFGKVILE
ncbi:carbohydrate-binding family 9-like protein [Spirochaeta cellobiosiphila]|uniref:carbohydrate-binding family 9-like protein n=1 Tax=Spirochaeta cellobiosiphila TaxID=504483 RepID=UPI0004188E61|nr:carbohydrate-binding family 9-like protein [Spirochaeta cellobiosiphila]